MYEQPLSSFEEKPKKMSLPISRKNLLIVGGVVLLIAGIAGSVWYVRHQASTTRLTTVQQQKVTEVLEDCDNMANPEACRLAKSLSLARELGETSQCSAFEGEEFSACVWLVAYDALDPTLCSVLSGTQKTDCEESAIVNGAVKNSAIKDCAKLTDPEKKLKCEIRVEPTTVDNCVARFGEGETCNDLLAINKALDSGKLSSCDSVREDLQGSCYDSVGVTDVDKDGLTASDEEYYGTDPNNRDTDGDTYLDGAEVNAGFNPKGEGKLVE